MNETLSQVGRDRTVPYYCQVAETLRGRIREGQYRAGDLIPPAQELEKAFNVSNITIRKALDLLAREGLVVGRRGIGTQVAQIEEERLTIEISGNFREWLDSASGKKFQMEQKVLEITTVPCPERVRRILSLDAGEMIWRMKRVRSIKGEPVSLHVNYGRPDIFGEIRKEHLEDRSFVEVIQEHLGIHLAGMAQRVEAAAADMDVAPLLGTGFGTPLFFVENTYSSSDGKPIEVSHLHLRGDRYTYRASFNFDDAPIQP